MSAGYVECSSMARVLLVNILEMTVLYVSILDGLYPTLRQADALL